MNGHRAEMETGGNLTKGLGYLAATVMSDVEAQNEKGETRLHRAVTRGAGDLRKAMLLLEHGADLEARDINGETALLKAGRFHLPLTLALLEKGADIEARDNTGETVLHKAAMWCLPTTEALIRLGANTSVKNTTGKTPLQKAKEVGNVRHSLLSWI